MNRVAAMMQIAQQQTSAVRLLQQVRPPTIRRSSHGAPPPLCFVVLCSMALCLLVGCEKTVAEGLVQRDAARALAVLDEAGIDARLLLQEERNADGNKRFRVEAPGSEAERALAVLVQQRVIHAGTGDTAASTSRPSWMPGGAPSASEAHLALERRLSHSLAAIPGIVEAMVHVGGHAQSDRGWYAGREPSSAARRSASVLLVTQTRSPGASKAAQVAAPDHGAVARLIAGAVPGMAAEDVVIIETQLPPVRGHQRHSSAGDDASSQDGWAKLGASFFQDPGFFGNPGSRASLLTWALLLSLSINVCAALWIILTRRGRWRRAPKPLVAGENPSQTS